MKVRHLKDLFLLDAGKVSQQFKAADKAGTRLINLQDFKVYVGSQPQICSYLQIFQNAFIYPFRSLQNHQGYIERQDFQQLMILCFINLQLYELFPNNTLTKQQFRQVQLFMLNFGVQIEDNLFSLLDKQQQLVIDLDQLIDQLSLIRIDPTRISQQLYSSHQVDSKFNIYKNSNRVLRFLNIFGDSSVDLQARKQFWHTHSTENNQFIYLQDFQFYIFQNAIDLIPEEVLTLTTESFQGLIKKPFIKIDQLKQLLYYYYTCLQSFFVLNQNTEPEIEKKLTEIIKSVQEYQLVQGGFPQIIISDKEDVISVYRYLLELLQTLNIDIKNVTTDLMNVNFVQKSPIINNSNLQKADGKPSSNFLKQVRQTSQSLTNRLRNEQMLTKEQLDQLLFRKQQEERRQQNFLFQQRQKQQQIQKLKEIELYEQKLGKQISFEQLNRLERLKIEREQTRKKQAQHKNFNLQQTIEVSQIRAPNIINVQSSYSQSPQVGAQVYQTKIDTNDDQNFM